MKQKVVAYLIKENLLIEDFIDKSSRPSEYKIDNKELKATLFVKRVSNTPKWLDLFQDVPISNRIKNQYSLRGALVVSSDERNIVLTFGHGRSLIKQHTIVRGFGLRVAMNLGDPKQLKSIDKSKLDKVALQTRSQASKNTGVENFDFEFDHEILKSLTAIVNNNDDKLEIVSGNDSVSLYTEINPRTIQQIADRLFDAYNLNTFKQTYPWAEYIEPEKDQGIIAQLDDQLINALNNKQYNDFWMAPPEIIDYMDFSGFAYKLNDSTPILYQEIDINSFMKNVNFRGKIKLSSFKNKKIFVLNGSEECIKKWSVYRCLNGEFTLGQSKYILNDGLWYKVKQSFYDDVTDYFNSINISNLSFPDYRGRKEGPYLRVIADGKKYALLDQKWVRPNGVSNNLEFCDLLSNCHAIIHVKKYGSSAVLNHLFAQAFQSIEMLMNSPEVIKQVNVHLSNTYLNLNFDESIVPRVQRIVLAIMYHRTKKLDIPFFAKVNLRHYTRKIKSMGFNVELAQIKIGNVMTEKQLEKEEKSLKTN